MQTTAISRGSGPGVAPAAALEPAAGGFVVGVVLLWGLTRMGKGAGLRVVEEDSGGGGMV